MDGSLLNKKLIDWQGSQIPEKERKIVRERDRWTDRYLEEDICIDRYREGTN
jgi:hypothetical protein